MEFLLILFLLPKHPRNQKFYRHQISNYQEPGKVQSVFALSNILPL